MFGVFSFEFEGTFRIGGMARQAKQGMQKRCQDIGTIEQCPIILVHSFSSLAGVENNP